MNSKKLRVIRSTAVTVAPLLLIASIGLGYAYNYFGEDIKARKKHNELVNRVVSSREYVVEENEPVVEIEEVEENTPIPVIVDAVIEDIEEEVIEEEQEVYSTDLLDSDYEFKSIDFDQLKEQNEDTVGWISIDGTVIDYPIMCGDDNEYYLHHEIDGSDSRYGEIFQDVRNNSLESDNLSRMTILYGHHMKDKSMFASICKYTKESFYEEHPFGIIYTPDGCAYKAEIFAVKVLSGEDDKALYKESFSKDYNVTYNSEYELMSDRNNFNAYIKELKQNSPYETDVDVEFGDNILAMVTCSYGSWNERTVVYAKLTKNYTNYNQLTDNVSYSR